MRATWRSSRSTTCPTVRVPRRAPSATFGASWKRWTPEEGVRSEREAHRRHHARCHRPHGHEPAPDPLDPRDPPAGRRGAKGWHARHARPAPCRTQRGEGRGARQAAWRRALDHRSRFRLERERGPGFFRRGLDAMRPKLLRRAIAAGKHIYCEKPVSTTLAEANDL